MEHNLTWKNKVKGPVIPIPTPFKQDLSVDYQSLAAYVDFLFTNGIEHVLTTVGTSRYNLLTTEEIKQVNKTVVATADNRGIVIVSNATVGDVQQAVDFAKHAEKIGADIFISYYPERYYGDDNLFTFHEAVAQAINIPLILHEMP
ncbi:MAG: dihydrodipicolinate synthase family protein, partial [Bacteroidota bacterium]